MTRRIRITTNKTLRYRFRQAEWKAQDRLRGGNNRISPYLAVLVMLTTTLAIITLAYVNIWLGLLMAPNLVLVVWLESRM